MSESGWQRVLVSVRWQDQKDKDIMLLTDKKQTSAQESAEK